MKADFSQPDEFYLNALSRLNPGKLPGNVGLRNSGKARHCLAWHGRQSPRASHLARAHTTVPHDHDSAHGGAVALCPGARGLAVATHTRRVSLRAGAAADNVAQAAAVRQQPVLTARPLLCGTLEALRAAVGVL